MPAGPFAGARAATVATLAVLCVAAWAITGSRMRGMDATDLGTLAFFTVTWVVMMAAMMFPSVAPFVAIYAGLQDDRRARGMSAPAGATSLLVAGYLAAWTAAGLAAYGLVVAGREIVGGRLTWDAGGRWVAVAVLVVAAAYEFTPLKDACLTRCRGPLAYMLSSWHDGRAGALRMGIGHGAWCIGCCWALMAALFALGVMSVTWMVVVALLIAAEKLLPWRRTATAGVAAALLVLAVGVAVYPA